MYNAPALAMAQEILLTEMYSVLPLDDAKNTSVGGRPEPNRFQASINGNQLSIGAYTDGAAYVEVIDQETGEIVVEEEFEGETEATINQAGSYIVQIYSGNTVMTGEFFIE